MDIWWQLPGNQRCLNSFAESLNNGQCLIITPVTHSPSGLQKALSNLLTANYDFEVIHLMLPEEAAMPPIDWLYENLVHNLPPDKPRDIYNLAHEQSLLGHIIMLTCSIDTDAHPWLDFINTAQVALRSLNALQRPRIALILPQGYSALLPNPDSTLSVQAYEPCCHLHEMRYLASCIAGEDVNTNLVCDLRIECAVQLALWDEDLCGELLRCSLEDLFSPIPILREFAINRKWKAESIKDSPQDLHARLQGWSGRHSGTHVWHSAWLALQGRDREIKSRLWKAQNIVIFPFIEEKRVDWIDKIQHLLQPPFKSGEEVISDPLELEIGQLYHFLQFSNKTIKKEHLDSIKWLRDARHKLAHLETLSAAFARSDGSPLSEAKIGW